MKSYISHVHPHSQQNRDNGAQLQLGEAHFTSTREALRDPHMEDTMETCSNQLEEKLGRASEPPPKKNILYLELPF